MLAAGRFQAEADQLRMFRHIATLDPSAPLPDARPISSPTGPRAPGPPRSSASSASPRGSGRCRRHRARQPSRDGAPASDRAITIPRPSSGSSTSSPRSSPSSRAAGRAGGDRARARPRVRRPDRADRGGVLARRGHVRPADHVGGGAARRRVRDRARSRSAGSRSSGHQGTTRSSTRRWGSASSATPSIAARHAQAELGVERVAIVDWDVHHGNGTEAIVRGDDSILFVSLHQWPFYPGTGGPETSEGNIVNIPLPAGSGDARYIDAFRDDRRAGRRVVRAGAADRLGRVRRARRRPARRDARDGRRVPRDGRALHAARSPASRPSSKAATTSRRCRASSRLRSTASRRSPSCTDSETAGVRPGRLGAVQPRQLLWEPACVTVCGVPSIPASPGFDESASLRLRDLCGGCRVEAQCRAVARRSSASRRDETPSLRSRLLTCERTVCSEM